MASPPAVPPCTRCGGSTCRCASPPADGEAYPIHRRVQWGALADLLLLDGRQYRSDQACLDVTLSFEPPCREAAEPTRTMLGTDQEGWLDDAFAAATGTWTVLGQQTVMTDLRLPNGAILQPRPVGRIRARAGPVAGPRPPPASTESWS